MTAPSQLAFRQQAFPVLGSPASASLESRAPMFWGLDLYLLPVSWLTHNLPGQFFWAIGLHMVQTGSDRDVGMGGGSLRGELARVHGGMLFHDSCPWASSDSS